MLEITQFDSMLKVVELGRCDLLPLSIFEGQSELGLVQDDYPSLKISTEFLITYYQEINFYLKKTNRQLADRLLKGLASLKSTGKLNAYMTNHSLTKNAFPLFQFDQSVKIKVDSGLEPNPNSSFYFDITKKPQLKHRCL